MEEWEKEMRERSQEFDFQMMQEPNPERLSAWIEHERRRRAMSRGEVKPAS